MFARATWAICSQIRAHDAAGTENLREVVALTKLSLEALVLLHQPLAIRLEQPLDLHRLGDHRRDDAEELRGPLVVAVRLEPQLDAERADGAAVHDQRHTHERPFVAVRTALGQGGLAADTGYDDRPRALDDASHQRAAGHGAVRHAIAAAGDRRDDLQVRTVLARGNRDRAAHGIVRLLENLEDTVQRDLEVQARGERLAALQERRQFANFARLTGAGDIHL